jgi:hypothetical protein
MGKEVARIKRWRDIASEYRLQASSALSTGTRLAFNALAECADSVADRMEAGTVGPDTARALSAVSAKSTKRGPAGQNDRTKS